jgi:hypothetical protein
LYYIDDKVCNGANAYYERKDNCIYSSYGSYQEGDLSNLEDIIPIILSEKVLYKVSWKEYAAEICTGYEFAQYRSCFEEFLMAFMGEDSRYWDERCAELPDMMIVEWAEKINSIVNLRSFSMIETWT